MTAIADASCVWLTTVRPDGSPHTTPVWFVLVDGSFWVATALANAKVKNVALNALVSLAIDGSGADPHVAQGHTRMHEPVEQFPTVVSLFAQKYQGWDVADVGFGVANLNNKVLTIAGAIVAVFVILILVLGQIFVF